jgi:Bacterial type III secretion protein (HrpB1_HrpK)
MIAGFEVTEFDHLLEIAHLALDERMIEEAGEMFVVLAQIKPTNPHPRIGQALIVYGQRKHDEAIVLLEGILRDFPRAIFTRSLLAKIMLEAGRPDWQRYAREALALTDDGVAADMARGLLELNGEPIQPSKIHSPQTAIAKPATVGHSVYDTHQHHYFRPV